MSDRFLKITDEAVTAKRGMNVEKYKQFYSDAMQLYKYIGNAVAEPNGEQFQDNAEQYVVKGAVLLAAAVFDVVSNHKTGKSLESMFSD